MRDELIGDLLRAVEELRAEVADLRRHDTSRTRWSRAADRSRQRFTACGAALDGDRQVRDDLPRIMRRPRRTPLAMRLPQTAVQAGDPHGPDQQHSTGLGRQALAVSGQQDPDVSTAKSGVSWSA